MGSDKSAFCNLKSAMTRWQHFLSAFRLSPSAVIVIRPERMGEQAIAKALNAVPDAHPVYRAIVSIIEREAENAYRSAGDDYDRAGGLAFHNGGGYYLNQLRDEIDRYRSNAPKETTGADGK